jgi:hypothetical protein
VTTKGIVDAVPKIEKTTFEDHLMFRCDLLYGELLLKILRELSKRKFTSISNDQQSSAWIWRGAGVEGDPFYWVKMNEIDIATFAGFFAGADNWGKFRRDVYSTLLEALSGIETDFVANLTATYSWLVPASEVGKLTDLIRFSHSVLPEDAIQPERFSTLLLNPTSKQRVLFEGVPDAADEFRLTLSVQTNQIENSLAKTFDDHFVSADAAYAKANSFIEALFER